MAPPNSRRPRFRLSLTDAAALLLMVGAAALLFGRNAQGYAGHHLVNVSYDPTRELYQDLNPRFVAKYERENQTTVAIKQVHGGSSYQARRVATGEEAADVVTLGLPSDVDGIRKRGLIADDWQTRLPNQARPYSSTIVFVVRHGNPRAVRDWPDLVKPGVELIIADPKTSGNGKLVALAGWGSVVLRGGSPEDAKAFLKALYDHAPFLVPAARVGGVAFAIEKKGDVHLAWENEALRETEASKGALEIVYPPLSILAEPSVALVDANVAKNGTTKLAEAYLDYLFSDEAQEIMAADGYRPSDPAVLARHRDRFKPIELFSIAAIATDWPTAERTFFAENGIVDVLYHPKPRTE